MGEILWYYLWNEWMSHRVSVPHEWRLIPLLIAWRSPCFPSSPSYYSFVHSGVFQTTTQFLNQQFRTGYLQPADQVHLYPSFWHVFQGWQVSILGMCFYSLEGIPPQAIPRCWGSLEPCASISKTVRNLVWNLFCAITQNCCVVLHR